MSELTDFDNEILSALKAEYEKQEFGFIKGTPTWHIKIRLENKFTFVNTAQIRSRLKRLEQLGYVSGELDGQNILWTPAEEHCHE